MALKDLLFGAQCGMTKSELRKMTFRNSFSDYLPFVAYDPETEQYHNNDNSVGFLWECTPLLYGNDSIFNNLNGLFTSGLPEGSVIQFILYADPDIHGILESYQKTKKRKSDLIRESVSNIVGYYEKGTKGFDKLQNIPARNYRLLVALKFYRDKYLTDEVLSDIRENIYETLKGVYLNPIPVSPHSLINIMSRLFNDLPPDDIPYEERTPINRQIILSDTVVRAGWDRLMVGNKILRCQTVRKVKSELDPLTFNFLSGGIWGGRDDGNQINDPFIITVNIIFENQKANLHGKCNFVLQQEAVGSFAPSLRRKQEEYMWATGEIEKGTPFIRIMPIMWHISDSEARSKETSARVKRMWEAQGFVVQKDRGILNILFLSSLPFGLFNVGKNLNFIKRDSICQPEAAVRCLPIQADFSGSGSAVNLFVGRKGQLVTMDIFDKRASNNNALISAASGSGKSFLMNSLVFNYYSSGSLIRIIDIGQSYKKLCSVLNGNFITFSKDSNITLNPFTNIIDINDDISSISSILAQMIYSTTQEVPDETEMTLIKNAIYWAYRTHSNDADVDRIYEYLKDFPRYADDLLYPDPENADDGSRFIGNLRDTAIKLAFNLQNFTSRGTYGKWFNGPSTLDIARDDFVILELEELAAQPELFGVITLQIINYVTSNLYLSDRSQKRLIIFDEAWRFFKEGSMLKNVIEDGYRRARKYGGSFTTITQSLLDLKMAGGVGDVIRANSAYKFYLESSDFEKARQENIIDYAPFVMDLLKSVQNRRPNYSEVFVDGPAGLGVMRLIVDPYSYYIYTSDAGENAKINSYVKSGMSYAEAISKMVADREAQA